MIRPCGCDEGETYQALCTFHWNESALKANLSAARQWEHDGPLDKNDPADRRVLNFYDELCYWAAKGIGYEGVVAKFT